MELENQNKLIADFIVGQVKHSINIRKRNDDALAMIRWLPEGFYTTYAAGGNVELKFDQSMDWLIPAWDIFRCMTLKDQQTNENYIGRFAAISKKIKAGKTKEAFIKLTQGIEWFNKLAEGSQR